MHMCLSEHGTGEQRMSNTEYFLAGAVDSSSAAGLRSVPDWTAVLRISRLYYL